MQVAVPRRGWEVTSDVEQQPALQILMVIRTHRPAIPCNTRACLSLPGTCSTSAPSTISMTLWTCDFSRQQPASEETSPKMLCSTEETKKCMQKELWR